jgi:hypothetical protein
MDGTVQIVLWLFGFVIAVIIVIAQFQLFGIRRSLDELVRLQGPNREAPSATELPPPAPIVTSTRGNLVLLVVVVFVLVAMVAATLLSRH